MVGQARYGPSRNRSVPGAAGFLILSQALLGPDPQECWVLAVPEFQAPAPSTRRLCFSFRDFSDDRCPGCTPGPLPFSSMNSMPAISRTRLIASTVTWRRLLRPARPDLAQFKYACPPSTASADSQ
jgi:hypothetical protein